MRALPPRCSCKQNSCNFPCPAEQGGGEVGGFFQSPTLQLFPICQQFSFGLVKLPGWLELATWVYPLGCGVWLQGAANPARDSGQAFPLNLGVLCIPNSCSSQALKVILLQVVCVLGDSWRSRAEIALKVQENKRKIRDALASSLPRQEKGKRRQWTQEQSPRGSSCAPCSV